MPSVRPRLLLLVTLSVLVGGCGASGEDLRPLSGDWRYRWGDPSGGPQAIFDVDDWQTAPSDAPVPDRQGDLLWLRLPIPEGQLVQPALVFRRMAGALEIWFEGRRVSRYGHIDLEGAETGVSGGTFAITVPAAAQGREVWLRIQSQQNVIGPSTMPELGEATRAQVVLVSRALPALTVGAMLIVVAFAVLLVAAWLRERVALSVGFFAAMSGALCIGLSGMGAVLVPDNNVVAHYLVVVGACFYPTAFLWVVRDVVLRDDRRWWQITGALMWGGSVVTAVSGLLAMGPLASFGLVNVAHILGGLTLGLVAVVREAWRGRADARVVMIGVGGLAGSSLVDTLPFLGVETNLGYTIHLGVLCLVSSFGAVLVRRAWRASEVLREQAQTLADGSRQARAMNERLLAEALDLLSSVERLRASGLAQNAMIEQQSISLQEAQVTAEELKRTSALAEQKARHLLEGTGVADAAGRAGEEALSDSLAGIEAIGRDVDEMARRMDAVEGLAQEIGGIVEVVKELADQSNMLALNAAIEAVRSGEHGKGFAVVAREVRRLADQSLQATARIREVLDRLAARVDDSAKASERGEQSIARTLKRLRGSSEQIRTLSTTLTDTTAAVRQISAAVTQQNAGIAQLFTVVEHLSGRMEEAVERIREADEATAEVERIAGRLSSAGNAAA